LSDDCISRAFHSALAKIGINEAERKRRGLSLHGWRHFLNTELQRQGLTIQQVQSVTGHKTDRMSEWYCHLDARNITDVVKAQEAIAGTMQAEQKDYRKKAAMV
jgi:site-specific recombinase XerD